MSFVSWGNEKIKKLNCWDMQLIKLSVFAFTLMIVKFWPSLLILAWYWYALIFVLAAIIPFYKVYSNK